jgi:septin family protein
MSEYTAKEKALLRKAHANAIAKEQQRLEAAKMMRDELASTVATLIDDSATLASDNRVRPHAQQLAAHLDAYNRSVAKIEADIEQRKAALAALGDAE